ncbi:MAG TPA: hypothetical protein DHV02_03860 [Neisseriales bacterium]|nr:hypothetical protein [Neisseriales bacterium]
MKKLPIGISTLSEIRATDKNYTYVDKTRHIARLVENSKYYFLSRPRRFGKSLFIDTLKQAFLGNKELFSGLYLEHNWDWTKQYPVLHFSFGQGSLRNREELDNKIHQFLDVYHKELGVESIYPDVSGRFTYLIREIANKYASKVVILIDEYDKPILDNINNLSIAQELRDGLKNFYSVIKESDEYVKFALLTGVSKFSKVSLFSGLNILDDLTLDRRYADICGYTQSELEATFAEYLAAGKVNKVELKRWYNGYNFAGSEEQKVYNPFDILLFFSKNYEYRNYWFETATPTFLVKLLQEKHYFVPNLERLVISDNQLSSFDIENIPLITLLFQTGYLTIERPTKIGTQYAYVLRYPNLEVKASLNNSLLEIGVAGVDKNEYSYSLSTAFNENNFAQLKNIFTSHFAAIPNDWYRNNNIADYEGFYASVIYSYLAALGYDLIAEDVTNHGKIDLTLKMPDKIIIVEFKLSKHGDAAEAIAQIKNKEYADKYVAENKPIYLIGISFDSDSRNVVDFACELFK